MLAPGFDTWIPQGRHMPLPWCSYQPHQQVFREVLSGVQVAKWARVHLSMFYLIGPSWDTPHTSLDAPGSRLWQRTDLDFIPLLFSSSPFRAAASFSKSRGCGNILQQHSGEPLTTLNIGDILLRETTNKGIRHKVFSRINNPSGWGLSPQVDIPPVRHQHTPAAGLFDRRKQAIHIHG